MSGRNSTVSLTLQVRGQQAGQEIKKITDQQISATKQINQQWVQIGSAQAKFTTTARAGTQATVQTARASDGLLRTNRMMEGVLRQQSIQTRIQSQHYKNQQTTVQRLTTLLQQQQQSAAQLARWMKQVESSSRQTHQTTQHTVSLWQKGAALTAGVVAGGAIVSRSLQTPRNYDQQLTYAAATATGGQNMSVSDRLAARSQLNEYVKQAVRNGGGTREDAAEAVNALIASGKYELDNVAPALNTAVKAAFSTDASATDAATLTVRLQDFGVTNLQKGHDIAVRGGQLGSFEYKDQAKWLAQQMAAARAVGYSGEQGLVELVAMNQVAMSTAATADEAGNNVVNLLTKLSSREFSKSIADVVSPQSGDPTKSDGKKKPKQIFDWSSYAIQQREQGVYGVEAFVMLLERQLKGNKQYQQLQAQALSGTSDERKAALEDMSNIAMGSGVGEIIADRQALMAALSVVYKKEELNKLRQDLPNAAGTVDADYEMVRQTEWAKDMAMQQEKLFAQSKAYDAVSESLGTAKERITAWAAGNESLAASAYSASVAVAALGAAAGIAAIASGGKAGSIKAAGSIVASKTLPFLKKAATPLIVGSGAYGLYDTATDDTLSQYQRNIKQSGIVGGTGGALAGAAAGAAVGSVVPFLGTAVGGLIGGAAGYFGGSSMGEWFGEYFNEQNGIMENQNKLIEEQNKLSRDVSSKINTLISVTQQNKPVINLGGSLMDQISQHARTEEKRHGVDLLSYGQK